MLALQVLTYIKGNDRTGRPISNYAMGILTSWKGAETDRIIHLNYGEVCTHASYKTTRTWENFNHQGTKMILLSDKLCLKLVSAIFYQIILFTYWQPLKNYEKRFLFNLKSSFCSRDIQIFAFLSSLLFFPVSHCFRGWFKKYLKVYDVFNCLNQKITDFFDILRKE